MVRFIEWKVDRPVAFNASLLDMSDYVCIDSGTNKLILMSADEIEQYTSSPNTFLLTAEEGGKVEVRGRGAIGVCEDVLHCPGVSANLISTDIISLCGGKITMGARRPKDRKSLYCEIDLTCRPSERLQIRAIKERDLWWIKKSQMFDLLLRGGLTVGENELYKKRDAEEAFMASLAVTGSENKPRINP